MRPRSIPPVLLALAVALSVLPGCTGSNETSLVTGAPAPDFSLPMLSGETMSLSQFRGQPVFINLWSLECPACIEEMPYLQAAYSRKQDQVAFVAMNIGDSPSRVMQFVLRTRLSLPVALDPDYATVYSRSIRYFPTTVAIDRDGILRKVKVGPFRDTNDILAWLESARVLP
ncbi:MAG: TlpA disulfide reductase family protein [Chloroflexota bacterium]